MLSLMNTHIFGGSGKTTLAVTQFLETIANDGGLFVDPNGSAVDTILSHCPKRAVLVIDPTDVEFPVGFNVLFDVRNKPLMTSMLLSTVKSIWKYDTISTPILDRTLYNTLASLLEYPDATLLDVEPMLTEAFFRDRVLDHVSDSFLLRKWRFWLRKNKRDWDTMIASTENKAGEFSEDPRIRNMIGQATMKFDLRRFMFDGGIILLRLPVGQLGQKTTMFGSLVLAYLMGVSYDRSGRFPFQVTIDDVQHFDTPVVRQLVSTGSKYGINVTVTNQYLAQLSPELQSSLIGNCDRRIMFRCGIEDSERLHRTIPYDNTVPKLHELAEFQFIQFDGKLRVFHSEPLPKGSSKKRRNLVAQSQRRYATPRVKVERKLATF